MFLRNLNRQKYFLIFLLAGAVSIAASFWLVNSPVQADYKSFIQNVGHTRTVEIGKASIKADLALTEAQQVRGLSGRASLAHGTGMLFVFDNDAYYKIWMKDMLFPIDVLWITADLKVADVVENMSPESYPTAYGPRTASKYVLEVPAGTVARRKISIGDTVTIK